MLGLNYTSNLVLKGRRDTRDNIGDETDGQGRKRKMNECEETEKKNPPFTHTCCKDSRSCPTVSQYHLDAPVTQDTRHHCLAQPTTDFFRNSLIWVCTVCICRLRETLVYCIYRTLAKYHLLANEVGPLCGKRGGTTWWLYSTYFCKHRAEELLRNIW